MSTFFCESQWIEVGGGGITAAAIKLTEAVKRHLDSTKTEQSLGSVSPPLGRVDTTQRSLWLLAGGALLFIALAYSLTKFWTAKRIVTDKPVTAVVTSNTPVIPEQSVAVLPFVDMSEKHDQEYFSDGLSEELINVLTKLPDLQVPARTSSFHFKGKDTSVGDIAKALGVAYVLEGSVRRSGKQLRVTAQLIKADTGFHVWSETYDRPVGDVFNVQDDVARAVVKALQVSLAQGTIPKPAGTVNLEAYSLYLQARAVWLRQSNKIDEDTVVDYLHKSLDADPLYADAWALLSDVLQHEADEEYL